MNKFEKFDNVKLENPGRTGSIRLTIPAKVAYNADAFQKSIHSLLDEIGCRACFSGVDCFISTFQDYSLDAREFAINPSAAAIAPEARSFSAKTSSTLNASMSRETSFDIKKIDFAINDILKEIGCLACCSGHDIFFQSQFDFSFGN
ncbi:MAG: hypothetical protein ACI837_002989 [Crocinitomicaceae bacterium]|jgi:hypothetical protein